MVTVRPPVGRVVGATTLLVLSACGFKGYDNLVDGGSCDQASGRFSLDIDNPYFPLPVGTASGPGG